MSGPAELYDAAAALLGAADDALDTTQAGRIQRVYVSPGPPVFDCEQMTVHVGGIQAADTSPTSPVLAALQRTVSTSVVPLMTFTLTVLRCVPVADEGDGVSAPSVEALSLAAIVTMSDLWAIFNFLNNRKRDLTLFPPKEREFSIDPAIPVLTSGGLAGWQIPVRVRLDGYQT